MTQARILVVDDDESIVELLKLHLRNAGYEVRAASDAIAAGYMVIAEPPELILCDVMMPHMDGFQFIAALKSDPTVPPIPVIFLTSAEEGDQRSREVGAVGYLTKPVLRDELLKMVAKYVPAQPPA